MSVTPRRSSRRRRSESEDPFLRKLRCLEEEYRRSRFRHGRTRSRRRGSDSSHNRRCSADDSDKENGERIAGVYRRTSHSNQSHLTSSKRDRSSSLSDEVSGECHRRAPSRSSRRRSYSSEKDTLISAIESDREGGECNPRDTSRPSHISLESAKQTDTEGTLGLLGDDPAKDTQKGPDIHVAVAERWDKILRDGLSKDQKRDLQDKYPTIGNCPLTRAPKLNPEIKTALSALAGKKDHYQYLAQNQLGAGINAIGAALTEVLKAEKSIELAVDSTKFIERLADAGRILADLHHDMSKTRKSFIVPGLNPIVKQIADESPIDGLLFGEKFSENLKGAKVMEKASKDVIKQGGSCYRKSIGTTSRDENRRFQSSRWKQSGYPSHHQGEKLNWRRPFGMNYRGTQRKGQKSKEPRPKDNSQHKD
ncbi:uncharacterized protein LOC114876523 [Osmia bicornis bicornis]|uniref:uncharacterized protein LOC114876523 n=1 Tax=Osmia bicornis bicornis TaxID=1437191 RepID=UPI0010F76C27|nr:uncharacterized protein LOC114876523 [Osmia bicornis bicornis]